MMIKKYIPFVGATDDEADTDESAANERHENVPNTGRFHKDLIAPAGINEQSTKAKVGNHHIKTFFINGWPDEPNVGFLKEVLMNLPVQNDISFHVSPYDSELVLKKLGSQVEQSKAQAQGSSNGILSNQKQVEDFQETRDVYNALKDTDTELFDVGMYVTIRGDTEDELQAATDELLKRMRSAPALLKPAPLNNQQLQGMQATSPTAVDEVGHKTEMMGGALGSMMPFSSKSIIENSGVDFGVHAGNGSPVIVDRWQRKNGYNQLTIGKIGSGKSFSTKLNILRSKASRDDQIVFLLDPVGPKTGFGSVNTAIKGNHVVVGGKLGLNPMEIRKTPQEILDRQPDLDPYTMTIKKVMDFFEMYFHQRGTSLGDSRGILELAVNQAYKNNGITRKVETHDNESPTLKDVISIIESMAEDPEAFAEAESAALRRDIEDQAARLITGLQQFKEGGQYENLAGESELDLRGETATYFDLSQQEGSGDLGLMMNLLFAEVYQIAKESDKNVLFAIDEAHYLMKDAKTMEYLDRVVRHSRHINLSINFITQKIEDFFSHEIGEAIAQNCSIRMFQRTESGIDDHIAKTLDLNEPEKNFIRTAQAGSGEIGYSEALIGVGDYGYLPIRVVASDLEESIINYDGDGLDETVGETADKPQTAESIASENPDPDELKEAHAEVDELNDNLSDEEIQEDT
jgi:hypothetical protein